MSDLQAKVDALGHLISWRKSGQIRCNQCEALDKQIIDLADQIKRCPITLTMDAP